MFIVQITALNSTTLATLRDFQDTEVVIPINESRTAKTTLSIYNVTLMKMGMGLVQPLSRMLKVWYNRNLIFWGRILNPLWDGEKGTVEIHAIDASICYKHNNHKYGNKAVDKGYFVDGSGMWVLAESAALTQKQAAAGYPSPGVVFGNDYTVHQPHIVPTGEQLEPNIGQGAYRRVARGDVVWDSMVNLSQILGPPPHEGGLPVTGSDFELQPIDAVTGRTTKRGSTDSLHVGLSVGPGYHAQLNTYDRQGTDRKATIIWHYGFGRNNLQNYTFNPNGDETKNAADCVNPGGPKSAHDGGSLAAARNAESLKEYGIYRQWFTSAQVDALDVLQAKATATVEAYAYPLQAITIYPKQQGPADAEDLSVYTYIDDYLIGDVISAAVKKGAFRMSGAGRIVQVTIKQVKGSKAGTLRAQEELSIVPEVAGAPAPGEFA